MYIRPMSDQKRVPATWAALDLASHLSRVKAGSYVDGRNFILYPSNDQAGFIPRKFRGTREIPFDAQPGVNTCLGMYTDETGNTLIAFIHNSNGDHMVLRLVEGEPQARTIVLPALGLSLGNQITGVALIDNRFLAFCDGMDGDYPKMFDLQRADMTGKRLELRLYLPPSSVIVDFREFRIQVLNNGSPVGPVVGPPAFTNATPRQVRDFRPMMTHFAGQWGNIAALDNFFTATASGTYVTLVATATGDWSVQVTVTDYINGIAQPAVNCFAEVWNGYNGTMGFPNLRLSRMKPLVPPDVALGTDNARRSSMLRNGMFQFCYGYRLRGKEKSLTSPVSELPVSTIGPCGGSATDPNMVEVDFSADKWLLDPATRGEVEVIDIYARDGNESNWFLAESLEKWEWLYDRTYRFYNDGAYPPADDLFVEASVTSVPYTSNAMEVFRDSDDNQRIVFGGIKEGDDPPAVDVTLDVDLSSTSTASTPTASVQFVIRIKSLQNTLLGLPTSAYEFNQAVVTYDGTKVVFGGMGAITHEGNPELYGQELPNGGFTVFAKGTPFYGISTQNIPVTALPCGNNSPVEWSPSDPDSPANNRGVYDATTTGDATNNCNDVGRAAIRRAIESGEIVSRVRIDGLREGEAYVFCLADYGTTIDDLNSTGLEWQRKSGLTASFGSFNTPNIRSERDQCTIIVPVGNNGAVIDGGLIEVIDRTIPGYVFSSIVLDGYIFDSGTGRDYSTGYDVREEGVSAERQIVTVQHYQGGAWNPGFSNPRTTPWQWVDDMLATGVTPVDHNGYFCYFNRSVLAGSARAAAIGVTGDPLNPAGFITGYTNSSVLVNFYQVLNDINASKWEGDVTGPLIPAGPDLHLNQWKRYIFANLNPSNSLRTHIRQRVVDPSGNPIQGVGAILEGGRYTKTGQDGFINLIAYGDAYRNNNDRVEDRLIWYALGPCTLEMPIGGKVQNIFISQFWGGNQFSETPGTAPYPNWLVLADRTAISSSLAGMSCFSRGGTYTFSFAPGRWDGSGPALQEIRTVRIPNLGEDLTVFDPLQWPPALFPGGFWSSGIARVRFTLAGPVPEAWIGDYEYLQFYVTKDGTRDFQLQWIAGEVTYSSVWDEANTAPTPTSFSSGTATEIYISLTPSLTRYDELHTDSLVGYLWQEGDILRIISGQNGGQVFSVLEYPITGQRGEWITLEADSSMPQIFAGMRIEIFRPAAQQTETSAKTFYAIPQGVVTINDPYGTPSWSVTTGLLEHGDTWLIPTNVPFQPVSGTGQPWSTRSMTRESKSFSDFFESRSWSRGKVGFVDPDYTRLVRGALMRYSNSFKPGTAINGLNIFDGLDFKVVENWMGDIMNLVRMGDVIVGVCQNGSFSVYVGIEQLQTTEAGLTEVVGGILGTVRPFAHKYGTRHRASVIREFTSILFYDSVAGGIIQYNSNQLQDVALQNNVSPFFKRKAAQMPPGTNVCAGWDEVTGEDVWSFDPYIFDDGNVQVEVPGESIKYYNAGNAWTAKLDVHPDAWGRTRQRLFSFNDGKLWLHNATDNHNEVYGVVLPMSVSTPFVMGYSLNHKWKNVTARVTGPGWRAVVSSLTGEVRQLSADMFKVEEIYLTASVDENLSGGEIVVEMVHEGPEYAELIALWTNQVITGLGSQLS